MAERSRPFRAFSLGLVSGVVAGAVAGAGAMLVAFPYLFPPPAASDAPPELGAAAPAAGATPGSGTDPGRDGAPPAGTSLPFRFDVGAPGRDAIHWADGTGRIVRTAQGWVLRLEADFRAGPGPNYWIYANTRPVGDERDFEADAGRRKLFALRAFQGAQNYPLPADLDPARVHTVTIWCETFGAYIGSGVLGRPPS